MKLTNEELQKLIRKCDLIDAFEFKCALTELQQYREALRFKSFDEILEEKSVQVKHRCGDIVNTDFIMNNDGDKGYFNFPLVESIDISRMRDYGYTGWRYPVGDLREGNNGN